MIVFQLGPRPRYVSDIDPLELQAHASQSVYNDLERQRWKECREIKDKTGEWTEADTFDLAK